MSRIGQHQAEKLFSFWEQALESEPEFLELKPILRKQAVSALIPALKFSTLFRQKVMGENWALIGDASGSAHSVSGGGIHYAFRTANLLANALIQGQPEKYQPGWRRICRQELIGPSLWGPVFYGPGAQKILSYFLRKTSSAKKLVGDLLSGKRLKRRQIFSAFAKMFKEALL